MSAVQLEGLTKRHGDHGKGGVLALEGLSLLVAAGELLVVVGPSGAGKSSLLRLVAGLDDPDAGSLRIGDRPMRGVPPQERGVGMVFQDHPLFPHLTVGGNLEIGLRLRKLGVETIRQRVADAGALLGIAGLFGRMPHTLSGGERQRVALGMALARRPQVLLLDEPLAQLDAPLRMQLREEIRRLQRTLRMTMIHVTHDQEEAMALGDRLAVLRAGVLQQVGTPMEVYRHPANAFVGQFLGMPPMNLVKGRFDSRGQGAVFVVENGFEWPVPSADRTGRMPRDGLLGVRPEHVCLTEASGRSGDRLRGVVESVECCGPEARVRVRVGSVSLIARADPSVSPEPGSETGLALASEGVHWFDAGTGVRW